MFHRTTIGAFLFTLSTVPACTPEAGRLAVALRWADPRPENISGLYLTVSVRNAAGRVTASSRPGPVVFGEQIVLPSIPHGEGLVVTAEFREGVWLNARVIYRGASQPFDLGPNDVVERTVQLEEVDETSNPEPGPPPVDTNLVRLISAPWGTRDLGGEPFFRLVGEEGAAAPGTTLVVFDRADVAGAAEVGRSSVRTDGSFELDLARQQFGVLAPVFVGVADADLRLSDTSTESGLQASRVGRFDLTASLFGKVPGSDFPNPHRLEGTRVQVGPALSTDAQSLLPSPDDIDAIAAGASAFEVQGAMQWIRAVPDSRPAPRVFGAMAWDPVSNRLVLVGGSDATGVVPAPAQTWSWDDRGWTEVASTSPAPQVGGSVLVPDPARERLLLLGGISPGTRFEAPAFSRIWSWDGRRWVRELNAESSFPDVLFPAAAYHEAQGEHVVFGGCTGIPAGGLVSACSQALRGTWVSEGERWDRREVDIEPPSRWGAVMAYDAKRERVLLFGGFDGNGDQLGDLWSWDGNRWTQIEWNGSAPPPRGFAASAYDRVRDRLIIFGGATANAPDDRVW